MKIKAGASAKASQFWQENGRILFLLLLEREGRSRRRERGYLPHVLLGRDINFAADSPGFINKF